MSDRKKYHVVPDGSDGSWKVKGEGSSRASNIFDNKADAVDRAKDLAKTQPLGQIIIHRGDGTIQTEHTYGKDQYPPKG